MSLVLAFDCAVRGLAVAVVRDGIVLAVHREDGREQAARLLPAIADTVRLAGVARGDLSMIAVTIGPGSFTGVRVGLAAARGLAVALDLPLAGLSTTMTLLAQAPADDSPVIAVIDSHLGDWFCALGAGEDPPFLATTNDLAERLESGSYRLIGPDTAQLAADLARRGVAVESVPALPDPIVLARLAEATGVDVWRRRNRAQGLPGPLYLRGVNITLPDGQRRTVD
jgi:tRNA threonylcarbamoyladenosine biosynthesis protein TsaB